MGTHVKSLTKVVQLPAILATETHSVEMPDLTPTSIIVAASAAGTLKTQVSPNGTDWYDVETLTTSTTKTLFYLTTSKYYGYKTLRLLSGTSNIVVGGHLILCEI